MSLADMQLAVARLLTDPAYRSAFFASAPGSGAAFGLADHEHEELRRLDPRKLGITCEGFSGKRFERVASVFPLTLEAMEALEPDARLRYLASTSFPPDEEAEARVFAQYVRETPLGAPERKRMLEDLLDVEARLAARGPPPRLPAFRLDPATTRPRRTKLAEPVALRGPLDRVMAAGLPKGPVAYPAEPRACLVVRDGRGLHLEALDARALGLLVACDGTRTLGELVQAWGGEAGERLARWLKRGVLDA